MSEPLQLFSHDFIEAHEWHVWVERKLFGAISVSSEGLIMLLAQEWLKADTNWSVVRDNNYCEISFLMLHILPGILFISWREPLCARVSVQVSSRIPWLLPLFVLVRSSRMTHWRHPASDVGGQWGVKRPSRRWPPTPHWRKKRPKMALPTLRKGTLLLITFPQLVRSAIMMA